jgi:hypothetical protein
MLPAGPIFVPAEDSGRTLPLLLRFVDEHPGNTASARLAVITHATAKFFSTMSFISFRRVPTVPAY